MTSSASSSGQHCPRLHNAHRSTAFMHVCPCVTPGDPVAVSVESYAHLGRGPATKSPAGGSRPRQSRNMNSLKMRTPMGTLAWSLHHCPKALPLLNHLPLRPLVRSSLPCVIPCLCLACGHLMTSWLLCALSLPGLVSRLLVFLLAGTWHDHCNAHAAGGLACLTLITIPFNITPRCLALHSCQSTAHHCRWCFDVISFQVQACVGTHGT